MRSQRTSVIGLVAFLVICYFRFEVGSLVTATSVGTWYQALHKAPFNPPDRVFAPVWIILYFLMAVAGWRVWRLGDSAAVRWALGIFAVQLALNMLWSVLFFGYQRIDLALAEMLLLLGTVIVATLLFWRLDRPAGLMLAPYALWLVFATILTVSIWRLN